MALKSPKTGFFLLKTALKTGIFEPFLSKQLKTCHFDEKIGPKDYVF
jgi:hypothetical protein